MQSFKAVTNPSHSHMYYHLSSSRFAEMGDLDQQYPIFPSQNDAVDFTPTSSVFGPLNPSLLVTQASAETREVLQLPEKAAENWRDQPAIAMGDNTIPQTDTSAEAHTNQFGGVQRGATMAKPTEQFKRKIGDESVTFQSVKRLAQNREAARKSRLRKKAYVQQLETSRLKLAQLEEELGKVRQQGMYVATRVQGHSNCGVLAFDLSYVRWLDEHQQLMNELRLAINTHLPDEDLRLLVEGVMQNYSELFRLKGVGSKSDIFHMLSGMWITPAERFFMWLGGFRSSEMLKILVSHLEPLTDQQLMGFCNLQQSSQQAEDALSQGIEALQQSLVEALSSTCLGPDGPGNMVDYMDQMAVAMSKLATLENFVHQADLLRQQTLQQLHRILTTRQAARALLVIHDYTSRLRALSSLWLARPKN